MAINWNNKKIEELRNLKNNDAKELYSDYEKRLKENRKDTPINSESDIKQNYEKAKNQKTKLVRYKISLGIMEFPITPEKISIQNPTEPKTFKNIFGQELIQGINVLPRIVSFSSYFPYFVGENPSSTSPKDFVDYFEKVKNYGLYKKLKIEGAEIAFNAYVTSFDYELIPGRDIDFTITLKEQVEVKESEVDL